MFRPARSKRKMILLLGIFVLGSSITMLSTGADGLPGYESSLPDGGSNFGCAYCHGEVGTEITTFGEFFHANGNKYDQLLGSLDSDRDGFTNDEEFNAIPVTNPGDPESFPGGSVAPEPEEEDLMPWILTMVSVMVLILDVSVILVLVVSRKEPSEEAS